MDDEVLLLKHKITSWFRDHEEDLEDELEQANSWDGSPEDIQEVTNKMRYFQELKALFITNGFILPEGVKRFKDYGPKMRIVKRITHITHNTTEQPTKVEKLDLHPLDDLEKL